MSLGEDREPDPYHGNRYPEEIDYKQVNKTSMKTSKIKTIVEVKEFTNDYGVTLYHSLEMENGDKIQIGKKKQQLVGWELTYEIIDDQQEYNKAKSVQKEDGTPQTNSAPPKSDFKQFKADPEKQASIELQVCLKEAINFHHTAGFTSDAIYPQSMEVTKTAQYFYEELFNK